MPWRVVNEGKRNFSVMDTQGSQYRGVLVRVVPTRARARARFRGCSNFCRCINTVEKQPPSAGSATFPWACVSPQLFAVYTLLWASARARARICARARVFVHASFNTRVNGLDQPAIFDFCNRKIERLLGNF